jgi:hypothetical protein
MSRGEWDAAEEGLRALVEWPGEPGIMRQLAASLLVRLLARRARHEEAGELLRAAAASTAGTTEIALVGPVTGAGLEAAWLSGHTADMPALAAPALALACELGHRVTESELTCLLKRAGHAVDVPPNAIRPWAYALDGHWHEAAEAWGTRGCRYEKAVELALAPDAAARVEGRAELSALGATATLAVTTPAR